MNLSQCSSFSCLVLCFSVCVYIYLSLEAAQLLIAEFWSQLLFFLILFRLFLYVVPSKENVMFRREKKRPSLCTPFGRQNGKLVNNKTKQKMHYLSHHFHALHIFLVNCVENNRTDERINEAKMRKRANAKRDSMLSFSLHSFELPSDNTAPYILLFDSANMLIFTLGGRISLIPFFISPISS